MPFQAPNPRSPFTQKPGSYLPFPTNQPFKPGTTVLDFNRGYVGLSADVRAKIPSDVFYYGQKEALKSGEIGYFEGEREGQKWTAVGQSVSLPKLTIGSKDPDTGMVFGGKMEGKYDSRELGYYTPNAAPKPKAPLAKPKEPIPTRAPTDVQKSKSIASPPKVTEGEKSGEAPEDKYQTSATANEYRSGGAETITSQAAALIEEELSNQASLLTRYGAEEEELRRKRKRSYSRLS